MAKVDPSILLPVGGAAGTGLIGWMIGGLTQFGLKFESLAKDHTSFSLTILFFMVGVVLIAAWQIVHFVSDGPPSRLDYVLPAMAGICILGSLIGYANSIRTEDKLAQAHPTGPYHVHAMRGDLPDALQLNLTMLPPRAKTILLGASDSQPFDVNDGDRIIVNIANLSALAEKVGVLAQCADPATNALLPKETCSGAAQFVQKMAPGSGS
jgi:hypothetical protein